MLLTLAVVLLLRPLWLLLTQSLPSALHTRLGGGAPRASRRLTLREIVVLSWAGTRGVISLAAIFTLPLTTSAGKPFPDRDLLLFCTYVVVVVTLIGQGVTFGPIVRALGVRADPADAAALRNEARAASIQAGLPGWTSSPPIPGCRIRNWPGCGPASTAAAALPGPRGAR